jgi:uncharacterized membrane protein (UPF0127 family)
MGNLVYTKSVLPSNYELVHQGTNAVVGRIATARNWLEKGIGVIGRKSLAQGEGLWLPGVTAIHTWFVAFPLDLLFLDENGAAVKVALAVRPWTNLVWAPGAAGVVELGAGTFCSESVQSLLGETWILRPIGE